MSMFSRMRVELMSSNWEGSCSCTTLPVIILTSASTSFSSPWRADTRRNTIWFMLWTDPSLGGA